MIIAHKMPVATGVIRSWFLQNSPANDNCTQNACGNWCHSIMVFTKFSGQPKNLHKIHPKNNVILNDCIKSILNMNKIIWGDPHSHPFV
jgi:hypothetical protein